MVDLDIVPAVPGGARIERINSIWSRNFLTLHSLGGLRLATDQAYLVGLATTGLVQLQNRVARGSLTWVGSNFILKCTQQRFYSNYVTSQPIRDSVRFSSAYNVTSMHCFLARCYCVTVTRRENPTNSFEPNDWSNNQSLSTKHFRFQRYRYKNTG